MLGLRRGTTPYIVCTVKDDVQIDYSAIKTVWITITQNGTIVLDKVTSDVNINSNNICLPLTQEDTLALQAGVSGNIQLRLLNDTDIAYASQQEFLSVDEISKDGVIV